MPMTFKYFTENNFIKTNPLDLQETTEALYTVFLENNPIEKVRRPKAIKTEKVIFRNDQDFINILEDVKKSKNKNFYALLITAWETGMREGKLAGLKKSSVDINNKIIKVRQDVQRTRAGLVLGNLKTIDSKRKLLISNELLDILVNLMNSNKSEFVFPREDGKMQNPSNISKAFLYRIKKLGLDSNLSFHSIRHTNTTILAEEHNLIGLKGVQTRLGHSDPFFTQKEYVKSTIFMQKDIDKIKRLHLYDQIK